MKQLEQENLDLREALETIADVLEEVGILDSEGDEEEPAYEVEELPTIEGEAESLPEDDPSNLIEGKEDE
jgi:hypothetical protein